MALSNMSEMRLTRSASCSIRSFEEERVIIESDPNIIEAAEEMYYPDLIVKGQKLKCFKTDGNGLNITLSQLHEFKLIDIVKRRKFARLAYLRVVWIPAAHNLPGEVEIGIKDFRMVEGKEIIDIKSFEAIQMHHYTYLQEFYFHKKDLNKISIFVNLKGYEELYKSDCTLGSIRIYWLIHTTNVPTQHVGEDSKAIKMKLIKMPSLFKSRKSLSIDEQPNEQSNESTLARINKKPLMIESNLENQEKKQIEYTIKIKSEVDFTNNELVRDKLTNLIIEDVESSSKINNREIADVELIKDKGKNKIIQHEDDLDLKFKFKDNCDGKLSEISDSEEDEL